MGKSANSLFSPRFELFDKHLSELGVVELRYTIFTRLLVLVVLGCVLPTILAAPSNAGEQRQNGLIQQNDRDDSEEVDENIFAVAAFVAVR